MQAVLVPIILLVAAGGLFFTVAQDQYNNLKTKKVEVAQLDEAIEQFKELESIKKERIERKSKIPADSLEKLEKGMLSDSVDTIRLTMDIQGIAAQNGIVIRKIDIKKDDAVSEGVKTAQAVAQGSVVDGPVAQVVANPSAEKYGILSISFSLTATYENFKAFLADLEKSLRVMDLVSLKISAGGVTTESDGGTTATRVSSSGSNSFNYSVQAQTYWLK